MTSEILLQQSDPDIQVEDLMYKIGYRLDSVSPRSEIRSCILERVRGAYEYVYPGLPPNEMLWFLSERRSGKSTVIINLTKQLEGTHLVIGPQYVVPGGPFQTVITQNPNTFQAFAITHYTNLLHHSAKFDYIWVDNWCEFIKSANDWESLFHLEIIARKQVTLIGTPGLNLNPNLP